GLVGLHSRGRAGKGVDSVSAIAEAAAGRSGCRRRGGVAAPPAGAGGSEADGSAGPAVARLRGAAGLPRPVAWPGGCRDATVPPDVAERAGRIAARRLPRRSLSRHFPTAPASPTPGAAGRHAAGRVRRSAERSPVTEPKGSSRQKGGQLRVLSPEGAFVNSPGRQPRVVCHEQTTKPRRGDRNRGEMPFLSPLRGCLGCWG